MKKIIFAVLCVFILTGCKEDKKINNPLPSGVSDTVWYQEGDNDYRLFLSKDGEISYYSPSAGNPYNDYDLCENYTYNSKNKKFYFKDSSCSMKFVSISKDGNILMLIVDGEEIEFKKEDD